MYFDINTHRECFKTNEDEAYFWHGRTNGCGGQNVAMDIATENNGKTLEMCMLDHRDKLEKSGVEFLDRPDGTVEIFYGSNQEESKKFWEDCSKAFAEQASGNVHVIEGSDLRSNGQTEAEYPSVYNRIEYPALEQNKNVDGITHIDPSNGKTTYYEPIFHNNVEKKFSSEPLKVNSQNIVSTHGGGARAPNGEPTNFSSKPTERGIKPTQEDNFSSNKGRYSERGQTPSPTESEPQSKGVECGFKPTESSNNSQINNSTTRVKLPQEEPKNASNASHVQRGKLPDEARDGGFKASTSSSDNHNNKVSASSNSAKAADDASKVAAEQSGQNIVPKNNGMNM